VARIIGLSVDSTAYEKSSLSFGQLMCGGWFSSFSSLQDTEDRARQSAKASVRRKQVFDFSGHHVQTRPLCFEIVNLLANIFHSILVEHVGSPTACLYTLLLNLERILLETLRPAVGLNV